MLVTFIKVENYRVDSRDRSARYLSSLVEREIYELNVPFIPPSSSSTASDFRWKGPIFWLPFAVPVSGK